LNDFTGVNRSMYLIVVSDTHDNMPVIKKFVDLVNSKYKGEKTIVHLGDMISPFAARYLVENLEDVKRGIFVYGNNDGDKILLYKILSKANWEVYHGPTIIELFGKKVLIMHGFNGSEHTALIASSLSQSENVDAVFYGHTHRMDYRVIKGKIIVNPGEACGYLTGKSTFMVLDKDTFKPEIVEIQ